MMAVPVYGQLAYLFTPILKDDDGMKSDTDSQVVVSQYGQREAESFTKTVVRIKTSWYPALQLNKVCIHP
jgi:hypothetical protein